MEKIYELKGINGILELYENKIVIKRKGFTAKMTQGILKGDKTIFLKQIAGIDIKAASFLLSGYIQFTIPGGNEGRKGTIQAQSDENTLMFSKKNNELALEIKDKIEELIYK